MFTINQLSQENSIELTNSISGSYTKIYLNQGASVQELILNSKQIIKDCFPLTYEESYASAIMFPFASRIENGIYSFKGREYELKKNDIANNCALHGLVYDKEFKLLKYESTKGFARVTLRYTSKEIQGGFPFRYELIISYKLTNKDFEVEITIKNIGQEEFPFTLGWHPYFYSSNLDDSLISFKAEQQAIFNENLILVNFKDVKSEYYLEINDNQLDDCFKLKGNIIYFKTPDYKVEITSTDDHLQLYTPKSRQYIAIEPITAPSNSFNNKIGLQVLESNQEYNTNWKIKLIDKDI